jgi:23S rRNA (adenine2030-N6)-methyltransferase
LWYPIKAHLAVRALKETARGMGDTPHMECGDIQTPPGTGRHVQRHRLLIFNTPFMVPERIEGLLELLQEKMGLYETRSEWIVSE